MIRKSRPRSPMPPPARTYGAVSLLPERDETDEPKEEADYSRANSIPKEEMKEDTQMTRHSSPRRARSNAVRKAAPRQAGHAATHEAQHRRPRSTTGTRRTRACAHGQGHHKGAALHLRPAPSV